MEKITSRKNQNILFLRELIGKSSSRNEHSAFVLEGRKLIFEALENSFELFSQTLYITEKALQKNSELIEKYCSDLEKVLINDDISSYISDTKSPQGMFCIFKTVDKNENYVKINKGKRLIILDGIQDMGNAGSIIRTAEAFGFDGVVLSGNSVDIYSPKFIRASMGSALRIPCVSGELDEIILQIKSSGFSVIGSILDEQAKSLEDYKFPQKSAIVIGSEGQGISEVVKNLCDSMIYIEINGTQSLNAAAAAAVICWEMQKK